MSTLSRHQCWVYDGAPSRHLGSLAQTLIAKLREGHRCIYLNSPAMVTGMHSSLFATGFNVTEHIERGALILSSQRDYLVNGRFDVDQMLIFLAATLQQTFDDGFARLFATGDLTWEFGNESNLDKLLEYERRLEEFMRQNPAFSGVCLYHRNTLPVHAINTACITHKAEYINETLSRLNPLYIAPDLPGAQAAI